MTIEEAIRHHRYVAERIECPEVECPEADCVASHLQLAEWLTELAALREEVVHLRGVASLVRPSVAYKAVFRLRFANREETPWVAVLAGDGNREVVQGYGVTPADAMESFDRAFAIGTGVYI
jgi:hypothetical protein